MTVDFWKDKKIGYMGYASWNDLERTNGYILIHIAYATKTTKILSLEAFHNFSALRHAWRHTTEWH